MLLTTLPPDDQALPIGCAVKVDVIEGARRPFGLTATCNAGAGDEQTA